MVKDTPIITGYYRYTDIWFEWASALPNPEDAKPLKGILAHDCLVHPDHPLRVEGVNGVQLYLGTFETGEARLLFSSAQVDYIRYWLHAMGLTKETIPLPYSDCLLTKSDLRSVTTEVYATGGDLKFALKKIDKNNKRLKGANPIVTNRRELFERVRTFWKEKKGIWCAVDFEAWELDHTVLTEFGWRSISWKDGEEVEDAGHLILQEHEKYRNTKYIADWRYNYDFGTSEKVKKSSFGPRIREIIGGLRAHGGPVFLVFHGSTQDVKDLQSDFIKAPLDGLDYMLPMAGFPKEGLFVIDTGDLFAALEGEETANTRSLERVCLHLQIKAKHLHNAGNDAWYTIESLKLMASGDAVDAQREARWPNKTVARSVKVDFGSDPESDFSDDEGFIKASDTYVVEDA